MSDLPEGARPRLNDFARWIGTWLFFPAFRVRRHGWENVPRTGPVVLVANHSSLLEAQLIFGKLGRRSVFLTKDELFSGLGGWFLRGMGHIPIRRGAIERAPLTTAVGVLNGGGVVCVFPEGTRGAGDVDAAEAGAAWLIRNTGAVLLPVACRGTKRPEGSGRRFRPVVDMLVGEPVALTVPRGRTGLEQGTEEIRVRLAALVRELDERRNTRAET